MGNVQDHALNANVKGKWEWEMGSGNGKWEGGAGKREGNVVLLQQIHNTENQLYII
jgi:hypothetical protein